MKAEQPQMELPLPVQIALNVVVGKALYTVVRANVPDLLKDHGPMTI